MSRAEHPSEVDPLANIPTKDLVEELTKREGVEEFVCKDVMEEYRVCIGTPGAGHVTRYKEGTRNKGPALILVVTA